MSRLRHYSDCVRVSLFQPGVCWHTCAGFVTVVMTAITLWFLVIAVKRPPMIITQPESVTVFSIEDFVMSCEAAGNPLPMLVITH